MSWFSTASLLALTASASLLPPTCDRVKTLIGVGDQGAPINQSYPVVVNAVRDDHEPLPGVQVLFGQKLLGTTDASGGVRLALRGNEGDLVSLNIKCPDTYASPDKPVAVGLRHFAAGSPPPRFETQCVPLTRSFVVGVRTENGAHLPIRRLNQVVGQTDDYGVAHVLLQAAPHEQVVLTLDTGENQLLRPQNPTLTFVAPDRDQLVLLEQKFTVIKRVVHVAPKIIPKRL